MHVAVEAQEVPEYVARLSTHFSSHLISFGNFARDSKLPGGFCSFLSSFLLATVDVYDTSVYGRVVNSKDDGASNLSATHIRVCHQDTQQHAADQSVTLVCPTV